MSRKEQWAELIRQRRCDEANGQFSKATANRSEYLGVCWHKGTKTWRAQPRLAHADRVTSRYLGLFDDEVDAARAFDKDCIANDTGHQLNFPDDPDASEYAPNKALATSKYLGVSKTRGGKWRCRIFAVELGTFRKELVAGRMYNKAVILNRLNKPWNYELEKGIVGVASTPTPVSAAAAASAEWIDPAEWETPTSSTVSQQKHKTKRHRSAGEDSAQKQRSKKKKKKKKKEKRCRAELAAAAAASAPSTSSNSSTSTSAARQPSGFELSSGEESSESEGAAPAAATASHRKKKKTKKKKKKKKKKKSTTGVRRRPAEAAAATAAAPTKSAPVELNRKKQKQKEEMLRRERVANAFEEAMRSSFEL